MLEGKSGKKRLLVRDTTDSTPGIEVSHKVHSQTREKLCRHLQKGRLVHKNRVATAEEKDRRKLALSAGPPQKDAKKDALQPESSLFIKNVIVKERRRTSRDGDRR